jgi:hypothetical protein
VVAQKQEVVAQEVHQAGEDQAVQVDHLDLRHLNDRTLQENIFSPKNANNDKKYLCAGSHDEITESAGSCIHIPVNLLSS